VIDEVSAGSESIGTTWDDISTWTGTFDTSGGILMFWIEFTYYRLTAGNATDFRLVVDGINWPTNAGWRQYANELSSHKFSSRTLIVTGQPEGVALTAKVQMQAVTSGTANTDANDFCRLTMLELP
jgi:hypothetical protein